MKDELINLRATLFKDVVIQNEHASLIKDILKDIADLTPHFEQGLAMVIGPDTNLVPKPRLFLNMTSEDKSFVITFSAGRIDIVRNKISIEDQLNVEDFINKSKAISTSINSIFFEPVSRLAYGCVYAYDLPNDVLSSLYNEFTSDSQENVVEWNIRRVYRELVRESDDLLSNVVTDLSRNIVTIGYEGVAKDRLLLTCDINTMSKPANYNIQSDFLLCFFDFAIKKMKYAHDYYFSIIERHISK